MNKKGITVLLLIIVVLLAVFFIFNKPVSAPEVDVIEDDQEMTENSVEDNNDNSTNEEGEEGDVLFSYEQNLTGTWQSSEDDKSVIVFNADGTTSDIYEGEELSSGTWELYVNSDAEYDPTGVFLKTNIGEEEYNYAIISLDEERLVINYLARGNTLEYFRVNQ